jgi:hypothetical protein
MSERLSIPNSGEDASASHGKDCEIPARMDTIYHRNAYSSRILGLARSYLCVNNPLECSARVVETGRTLKTRLVTITSASGSDRPNAQRVAHCSSYPVLFNPGLAFEANIPPSRSIMIKPMLSVGPVATARGSDLVANRLLSIRAAHPLPIVRGSAWSLTRT